MALGFLGAAVKGLGTAKKAGGGMKMARSMFKRKDKKSQQIQQQQGQAEESQGGVDKSQNPPISFTSPIVSDSAKTISKATDEKQTEDLQGTAFRIRKSVVDINTLLKGSLTLDKLQAKKKRVKDKQLTKKKQERKLEKPKGEGKGIGRFVPQKAKSLFGRTINFLVTIFWGWLIMKFWDHLPKLLVVVKGIAGVMNWLKEWGGKVLNALVTLVDWGNKLVTGLRDKVGDLFGEKGLKIFDKLGNTLKWVLNIAAIAAMTAGVVLMKSTSLAYWRGYRDGMMGRTKGGIAGNILKHGWKRAPKRLLIKMFGKKGAMSVMGWGSKIGATAKGILAAKATAVTGWVASVGLLSSALGEGMGWLSKKGRHMNKMSQENYEKQKDKKWWDPRKWGSWGLWKLGELQNRIMGPLISLFDIVGTPFRYLIEAIRYPFLDEQGQAKQRKNLAKFDGRIREQFRRFVNMFDFMGVVGDETGSWGNIFGHESAQKDLVRKLDDNPYKKISTYTEEDADQSETIIINNQSSSSSSSEDKSTSGDTVLAMQGAFTDTTDGKEFVGGNSAYDILHKGA